MSLAASEKSRPRGFSLRCGSIAATNPDPDCSKQFLSAGGDAEGGSWIRTRRLGDPNFGPDGLDRSASAKLTNMTHESFGMSRFGSRRVP